MEILGISPTEFLLVLIILVLVLGPTDLIQLGRKTGRLLRRIRQSETWILIANLSRALRNLPTTLAEETGADEIFREVVPPRGRGQAAEPFGREVHPDENKIRPPGMESFSEWTTPVVPDQAPENTQDPVPDAAPDPGEAPADARQQETRPENGR